MASGFRFEKGGWQFTATSLILPDNLPFSSALHLARTLVPMTGVQWWVGDLLNFAEHKYGTKYQEIASCLTYSIQTLMNWCSVCREFEPSRRREGLTFSHHAELCGVSTVEADTWLARAEEHGWSVRELRHALDAAILGQLDNASTKVGASPSKGHNKQRSGEVQALHHIEKLRHLLRHGDLDRGREDLAGEFVGLQEDIAEWLTGDSQSQGWSSD